MTLSRAIVYVIRHDCLSIQSERTMPHYAVEQKSGGERAQKGAEVMMARGEAFIMRYAV